MSFRLPVITRQTESSDRFGQCSGGGGESNSPETMLSYLCRFVAEAFEPSEGFRRLILERGGGTGRLRIEDGFNVKTEERQRPSQLMILRYHTTHANVQSTTPI